MVDDLKTYKLKSSGTSTLTDHCCAYNREAHRTMNNTRGQIGVIIPNKQQRLIVLLDSINSTHLYIATLILTVKLETNGLGVASLKGWPH